MAEKFAVYATTYADPKRGRATFRIGKPVDLRRAHARHERLGGAGAEFKHGIVRHDRKRFPIAFYEVRAVDKFGRRLDSNRSDEPIQVPYRAHRVR